MSKIVPTPWVQRLMAALAVSSVIAFWAVPPAQAAGAHADTSHEASRLRVVPSSGPAGTVVTVSGYVPAARHMTAAQRHTLAHAASVQFGGDSQGLDIETIRLHWSRQDPGDYTFRFRVPAEPWLTVTGEHPVVDGHYPVTVTCVDPGFIGCGLGVDARGTFTLTGLTRPRRKAAVLHFSPRHGAPGTWVHVTGWAPLTAVSRQPSAYQLTVNGAFPPSLDVQHLTQAPNGTLSGAFRVPTAAILGKPVRPGKIFVNLVYQSGQVPLTVAATPFRLQRPRTWASLGRFRPQQVADNAAAGSFGIQFGIAGSSVAAMGAPISRDTGEMVVSSVPGTLWIDRSAAWTPVLTAPLASLAQTMGYPIASDATQSPIVTSATLLPAYPTSLFVAVEANSTAKSRWFPPEFNIACYSTNDGTTWHAVPIPHGYTAGDFGGYQTDGSTLAAYFTRAHGGRWKSPPTVAPRGPGSRPSCNRRRALRCGSGPCRTAVFRGSSMHRRFYGKTVVVGGSPPPR